MVYVSARYGPPSLAPMPENAPKQVIATDEEGIEWSMQENSEVGDWLRYVEGGGTIDPVSEEDMARYVESMRQTKLVTQRDVYAELEELNARVTALEER